MEGVSIKGRTAGPAHLLTTPPTESNPRPHLKLCLEAYSVRGIRTQQNSHGRQNAVTSSVLEGVIL